MALLRSNFYLFCLFICAVMFQQVHGFKSTNTPRLRSTVLFAAKKYCVNVNLYVKPERREEFLRVIRINAQGTRTKEPLNIAYTWGESVNEPNTFHFQEQFMGEEGFVAHTQAPHFEVWKQFADAEVTVPFNSHHIASHHQQAKTNTIFKHTVCSSQ